MAGNWRDFDAWETRGRRKRKRWPSLLFVGILVYGLGIWTGASIWSQNPASNDGPSVGVVPENGANGNGNSVNGGTSGGNTATPPTTQVIPPDGDTTVITGIYRKARPSIVTITAVSGTGSKSSSGPQEDIGTGFFVDNQGDIATNNHVVSGEHLVSVTLSNNRIVKGTVIGTDPLDDLAIVRIPTHDEPAAGPLKFGASRSLQPGDLVIAIGNPFELTGSVTSGIVSGLDRAMPTANGREMTGLLQTDAALNPGNSGGPLLNAVGQVIGINTAIESPVQGSVGIGFAIPITKLQNVLKYLLVGEAVPHAWLGIEADDIIPALQQKLHLPVAQGVLVIQTVKNGPAARAGLHGDTAGPNAVLPKGDGDIIVAVNNEPVNSVADLTAAISQYSIGTVIKLSVIRHGKHITIPVTLGPWKNGK